MLLSWALDPCPLFSSKNTTWLYFSSSLATVSVSLNRSCSSLQGRSSVSNCSLHWSLPRDWEAPEGNEAQILFPARCFHPRSALRLLPLTLEPSYFPPKKWTLPFFPGLFPLQTYFSMFIRKQPYKNTVHLYTQHCAYVISFTPRASNGIPRLMAPHFIVEKKVSERFTVSWGHQSVWGEEEFKPKTAWLGAQAASVRLSEKAGPATRLLFQIALIFKKFCTEDLTSSTTPHRWEMSKTW